MSYDFLFNVNTKEFKIFKVDKPADNFSVFDSFNSAKANLIYYIKFIIFVWDYTNDHRRSKEFSKVLDKIYLLNDN